MSTQQDSRTPPRILTEKPSAAFSTSSAASATSAGTPRSGGSRLLFGEIDTTSERSDSFASVCSLVLSESSLFLRFWLNDDCRDGLISYLPTHDLTNLRLVCHDFAVRTAPALFADLSITFKASTFGKPSRLAALHRLGFYTKTLTFNVPHNADTFLPPLIEPETGEELSYTYAPRTHPPALREPKYGDAETTEILTRQYPPLFHAATNVHSFISAFSAFVNLTHLTISCPGYDHSTSHRRSTVDYTLISLRLAIERNCLNALDTLTLAPIHSGNLHYLTPLAGYGATPASLRKWSRIQHLTIHADTPSPAQTEDSSRLLQNYVQTFKKSLKTFIFRWNGSKASMPLLAHNQEVAQHTSDKHPAFASPGALSSSSEETIRPFHAAQKTKPSPKHMPFPCLRHLEVENASATAGDIAGLLALHQQTIEELDFREIDLTSGTWEQAFSPLTRLAVKRPITEVADIPIMLSPRTEQTLPRAMDRIAALQTVPAQQVRSMRASRWLGAKRLAHLTPRTPSAPSASAGAATKIVKQGLLGCEAQVKRVFKGKVFAWI